MRNITFDECNDGAEICGLFNKVFANQEQMEAKIMQLDKQMQTRATKSWVGKLLQPKKKGKEEKEGNKMKSNGSASMRVIAILMLIAAIGSLCYAAYVPGDINYDIASNPESLSIYLRDVTNNMRSNSYVFEPRVGPPATPVEGMVYYRDGTDTWLGYTPAGWITFDLAGGNTLVGAYNSGGAGVGRTILANDDAVVISNAEADANPLLELTFTGGAVDAHCLIATTDGTGAAIEIENTGTGPDFEGTAGFTLSRTGQIVGLELDLTGANGITLQNDETITNADGSIVFTDSGAGNTLIFDLDDGATSILIDSGDVVTLDWGTVDNFDSLETIVFDDAATSAISMTGTGTNNLLITQLGVGDESLVLNSDGSPVDAVTIEATAGGIDVDAALSIVITSTENQPDAIVIQSTVGGIDIRTDNAGAGDDIDITATLGSIDLLATEDAANAITLTANGGVSETIVITSTLGTGAGAVTIVGTAGGIDIDAVDDINIAVVSSAAADDLALVQTGAFNASITLAAAGTGVDAIELNASAGGIDIDAALAITMDNAAGDITFTSAAGSVVISASEDAADAINIDSTAGGIDIDAVGEAGQDIIITNTGGSIALVATESAVNSIVLQSTLGGIDIQCDAATSEDIDITNTGGSVNIVATENAADSIVLQSTLGGIDIQCDASGTEALNIVNTGGIVSIVANYANAAAITIDAADADGGIDIDAGTGGISIVDTSGDIAIQATGAVTDNITITNTTSTENAAIALVATAGGVEIDAAATEILALDGGSVTIDSKTAGAGAIALEAATGATDTITVLNTAGTATADGAEAIQLTATAGGIGLHAVNSTAVLENAAAITLLSDAGGISIHSEANVTPAIQLLADGGIAETILIQAAQSTEDASISLISTSGGINVDSTLVLNLQGDLAAASAVVINASAGGFAIDGNGDASTITLTSNAGGENLTIAQDGAVDGSVIIDSVGTALDAIHLYEHAGVTTGGILIQSAAGVGVSLASASSASVQLLSDDGGIGLLSNANLANAIRIEADGGASETVVISSIKGTGAASVNLDSLVGGITVQAHAAGMDLLLNSVLGSIHLEAEEDSPTAISIIADGVAATGGIWIQNETGTSITEDTAAIEIQATLGGIHIKSDANLDDAIVIRADGGGTAEISITNDQGTAVDSVEIISILGGVTIAGGADDNITLTTGAAGGAAGNVVFTNGQTRKLMFLPKTVELDGANPPALGSIGTNAQARFSVLQFDANPNTTGDDMCYISWMVPDGYIVDSARLNIAYSFSTAEAAADECQFDFTINAVAPGELLDQAGTALDDQTTVISAADADNGKLHVTQYNIDGTAEVIAVDDLVTIKILVDEDSCAMDASGTLDVLYFEIEWESTE